MIIQEYIDREGEAQIMGIADGKSDVLYPLIESIMRWGSRRGDLIEIPEFVDEEVPRLYEHNGRPMEIMVPIRIWPLERSNSGFWGELDVQISILFRQMKGAGIHRPSIVSYCMYRDYIFLKDIADSFDGNPAGWAGANFVLQRLHSTARLAARYDRFDCFGPVVERTANGVIVHMSRSILRPELVRRGLVRGRKGK